jgi:cytochrome c554/c'-like protein
VRPLGKKAWLLLVPVLAAALASCGEKSRSVSYEVSLAEGCPGRLAVAARLRGFPRDLVTLKGYAPSEVLRIENLEALGPNGESLSIRPDPAPASPDGSPGPAWPVFRLHGPLPPEIVVRYRVSPGRREGNTHVGFTGRVEGFLDREFGLVTGREIFLLPEPAEDLRDLEVRFSLPPPWTAVTPWTRKGDRFRPGIGGRWAAEHLVSATLGLGRFVESASRIGRTLYRLEFEAGISGEDRTKAAARLEAVTARIRDLFGRDLGQEYVVVVAPRSPAGDEIRGEGWATGQGDTLIPPTGSRLRRFAAQLIEAYTKDAPFRTEVRGPEEYWLVDAIRGWYSRRVLSEAGGAPAEEFPHSLAVAYLTSLNVEGLDRNLEQIYSRPGSHRIEMETLAPFALGYLDHELRGSERGSGGFDPILARMFRETRAPSVWSILPEIRPGFREEIRKLVQGKATLPAEKLFDLPPTRPDPDPPRGPVARTLRVLFTGKTEGYLENCGCKVNQAGGVARRASEVEKIRRGDPGTLLLDAGSFLAGAERLRETDFLSREEQGLYLRTLDWMRYDAAALGVNEVAFGLDSLRNLSAGARIPFLLANVRRKGAPVAPPWRILTAGGLKIAVTAILEPPDPEGAEGRFEDAADALEIADPVESLAAILPELKQRSDLVVVIGRLTPFTIRKLVKALPETDLIVSTEFDAPFKVEKPTSAWHAAYRSDVSGFLGRTLVAYTNLTSYGLGTVRIGLDSGGRIARAGFDDVWLDQSVPDEPRVRRMIDDFYGRVGRLAAAQQSVEPPFAGDPVRMSGRYVGVSRCKGCHTHEYLQWMTTPHATAYKTLLDRHRHYQPRCVSCHVVGYGTASGYRLGDADGALANVQCEVCHGPGGRHADAPQPGNILRRVPEKVCLECHNPDHSDRFVYAERLPRIVHTPPHPPAGGAAGLPAAAPAGPG